MSSQLTLIGFGEAGRTFAAAGGWSDAARVFDIKTGNAKDRAAMIAAFAAHRVSGCETLEDAVRDSGLILSLVTADRALEAARSAARHIRPGALFCDLNSVAPASKRAAAGVISAAGGHYVDVAVMAPVAPAALDVPLLLCGPKVDVARDQLARRGFTSTTVMGEEVGRASAIKMIRSVAIKGIEAITAECLIAAEAAGVRAEVLASLDAGTGAGGWEALADYRLDRMLVHGLRRAAEMEEVVRTLADLGIDAVMSRATVERQRAAGWLGLDSPPEGLGAKLRILATGSHPGRSR